MFKVVGVRYLTTADVAAGQIPTEATVLVDTINDAWEHIFCIRSHVDEFDDDLVYVGGDAMYEAWATMESEEFKEMPVEDLSVYEKMNDTAHLTLEYSGGDLVSGTEDPKYASIVDYSAMLMRKLIETGRCEVLVGQVLD